MRLNPGDDNARMELTRAKMMAVRLNEAEYRFLTQQAKANHVLKLDKCNKYFHGLMKAHGKRDHIASIQRRDGAKTE